MAHATGGTGALDLLAGARMIGANAPYGRAVRLSRAFELDADPSEVTSARLVATAHGLYEAALDGRPVDDSVLNPGWTSYEWRLAVRSHDVTALMRAGGRSRRLDVTVGNGWWRGRLGFDHMQVDYGEKIGAVAALEVTYADGHSQVVATDPDTWTASETPVRENSLYNGETIDARVDPAGHPLDVEARDLDRSTLFEQAMPPVRRQEVLHPQRVWASPSGRTLVDFGQNLVGWVRVRVSGPRGTEVTLRHAEVLEHGELGTRPLREARATDVLVLSGGEDVFEPTMTSHGFRYVEVTGWPGELDPAALEAVAISTDVRRSGWFECSNADVNQLVSNTVWSQRDNFVSLPTDCPQRDERMGWTGDIAVFAPTAAFQFDCRDFLGSWMQDLIAETEHSEGGTVPVVVPDVVKYSDHFWTTVGELALWGDAAAWVPDALWRAYGDIDALREQYPAMCLHLSAVEARLSPSGLWDTGLQLGDWLDPDAPPEAPMDGKTDKYLIAQACLCRSAAIAERAAGLLGEREDQGRWAALSERSRAAFRRAYVLDGGRLTSDAAAAYALALHFGLLEGEEVPAAADRLAELVREAGYRVSTGFAGTPYVTWALSENGHVEDAYRLLLEDGCPSWLYPVRMGATTVWERWDSMMPDGTINPGGMTSFNHYALGGVCDWVYQVVGGIRAAEPGYARVRVQPQPGPGIDWARCAYDSVRGRIEVSWRVHEDGAFELTCTVPEGVPADVVLPDGTTHEVVGGTHRFGCAVAR